MTHREAYKRLGDFVQEALESNRLSPAEYNACMQILIDSENGLEQEDLDSEVTIKGN